MTTANFYDFMVFVDSDLWERAKAGDDEAKSLIADELDGINIYWHIFSASKNQIAVSIADVITLGIVKMVTLHRED